MGTLFFHTIIRLKVDIRREVDLIQMNKSETHYTVHLTQFLSIGLRRRMLYVVEFRLNKFKHPIGQKNIYILGLEKQHKNVFLIEN